MKDNPSHPWDGFLVGPENSLAHAGLLAMARGDSAGASPLVVHGPSGSGKTRLLEGLLAEWIARRPGSAVAFLAAEEFASLCARAADRSGGFVEVRERFRQLSLLVLDDIHALEGASMAQDELAHTLDALDEGGGTVAVSARVGPGRWSGWPSRLVNRLIGGWSVRVEPPGPASRRRFVMERARAKGLTLSAQAVESLAESAEDYRSLEGLIARLEMAGKVDRRALDGGLTAEILAHDDGHLIPSKAEAMERIARAVALRFGVNLRDLRSASRRQTLVVPRHLAIYLARQWTGLSFAALGQYFGKRDAATIRHACKMAAERLAADPAIAAEVAAIERPYQGED